MSTKNLMFSVMLAVASVASGAPLNRAATQTVESAASQVTYHTREINGVEVFYREAGPKDAPTIVLLHGFPTSSHMFRNLIPKLSDRYHVIAPDYPGYGNSSMPSVTEFEYTFDNMTNVVDKLLQELRVDKYSLYLMDYGAPVGFRLATRHPERVDSLIIQNGNAYDEGLRDVLDATESVLERSIAGKRGSTEGTANHRRDEVAIHTRRSQHRRDQPRYLGPCAAIVRSRRESGDSTRDVPRLWQQSGTLSKVARVLTEAPATDTDRVGQKRSHLPCRRSSSVQARFEEPLNFTCWILGIFALEEDGDIIAKYIRDFLGRNVDATTNQVSSK